MQLTSIFLFTRVTYFTMLLYSLFVCVFLFRLLSLTERFQQLWVQQYQNPSNGLNNIIGALNTSANVEPNVNASNVSAAVAA
jgi:hypothetical protein